MSDSEKEDWADLIKARIGADGRSRVEIAAYQMEDPYVFGRFLGEVALHGGKAYSTTWSFDEDEAVARICQGFSDMLRQQDISINMDEPGSLNS
ncbi:hypothetical protein [Altererythrobacter sp. MF3-039]|uniref:hypothetical protein n=1 Tax=Altererythrobacter sp. MF3-039 TaxID=3252901 RepID=UPI00390CB7DA